MSIGENIKEIRKENKLTQVQLAEKAKISRSYLGDIEKDRYNASLDVLQRIAVALNVTSSTLLGEDGDPDLIKVNKEIGEMKNTILKNLNLLTDDEGYFYEYLHEEVFEVIKPNLYMAHAYHDPSYTNFYNSYFTDFFKSPDEYTDFEQEEAVETFNQAYDYRKIKEVLEYSDFDAIYEFNNEIKSIINKHNLQDKKDFDLNKKDEQDIQNELQKMIDSMNSNTGFAAADGSTIDELDEEDKELLLTSLEQSLRIAKRIAKQKFTPKKYRN